MAALRSSVQASINQCDSPLSRAFFSPGNMAQIQTLLRTIIKEKTGYIIGKQSDDELAVIMRALFVLHAQHGMYDVDAEVRRLNALVLAEIVPMVGTGIAQHLGYLRDASTLPDPIPRSMNSSIKGTKTAELFRGM